VTVIYAQPLWDRTDTGLCETLRSVRLNSQRWTKLEMMHILQAQVYGCISANPGLPYHNMKRETSDASKSQLNQANWNRKVLKFSSENHKNIHWFSLNLLVWFSIWSHDLKYIWRTEESHVTISVTGCASHT